MIEFRTKNRKIIFGENVFDKLIFSNFFDTFISIFLFLTFIYFSYMNLSGMSIFVPGLGQHGMQQYGSPNQKQLQILQQQQQLLMQEIALKKAQLLQQQHQHQMAVLQQQAQHQQQQQQQQVFQQQQQPYRFQPINKGSTSPDCSSGTSSPISHFSHRTFDQIEDWEVPSHDLIQKIIQQVIFNPQRPRGTIFVNDY